MEKTYVSSKRGLTLLDVCQFEDGEFVTSDPTIQAKIEASPRYKVSIFPKKDYPPAVNAPALKVVPAQAAIRGGVSSRSLKG